MEVEKTRSTPSVRWHQISTSNSSMMASTTRIQTISGGEGDLAAWLPDLRFDIKNPPPVSRGGLTITRDPFRCRCGHRASGHRALFEPVVATVGEAHSQVHALSMTMRWVAQASVSCGEQPFLGYRRMVGCGQP